MNSTTLGFHGTSWMLQILAQMDYKNVATQWIYTLNVYDNGLTTSTVFNPFRSAQTDISGFYCPTRRGDMNLGKLSYVKRPDSASGMAGAAVGQWTKGGNDYSGCAGRTLVFNDMAAVGAASRPIYALLPDQIQNDLTQQYSPSPESRGVFSVNSKTRIADISDGTSQSFMVGEAARLNHPTNVLLQSNDGWAWGGAATLFTARLGLNKGNYDGPASDHDSGAFFCFADGRVGFINQNLDVTTFRFLSSISDAQTVGDYE